MANILASLISLPVITEKTETLMRQFRVRYLLNIFHEDPSICASFRTPVSSGCVPQNANQNNQTQKHLTCFTMDHQTSKSVDGMSSSNNMQPQQNIQQQRVQAQIGAQSVMPVVVADAGALAGGQNMTQQQRSAATTAMATPLMMNLMTNPALAAAAAASPLFPPAAMLSNPGAFLSMPEAFALSAGNLSAPSTQQQPANALGGPNAQAGASNPTGLVTLPAGVAMPPTASLMGNDSNSNNNNLSSVVSAPQPGAQPGGSQQSGPTPIAPSLQPPPLAPYNIPVSNTAQSTAQPPASALIPGFQSGAAPSNATGVAAPAANSEKEKKARTNRADLTPEEKAKQNRDRNREHARSTRLRKKAYVQKLKELVECLHAERTEEVRQRRVAIQHLAEKQNVRRNVVRNFLRFHASHETDSRKWGTILEDEFWLKQPVTPYRSFRRAEIQQVSSASPISCMCQHLDLAGSPDLMCDFYCAVPSLGVSCLERNRRNGV